MAAWSFSSHSHGHSVASDGRHRSDQGDPPAGKLGSAGRKYGRKRRCAHATCATFGHYRGPDRLGPHQGSSGGISGGLQRLFEQACQSALAAAQDFGVGKHAIFAACRPDPGSEYDRSRATDCAVCPQEPLDAGGHEGVFRGETSSFAEAFAFFDGRF